MFNKKKALNELPNSGTDVSGPNFDVKKMPKGYKTGRFKSILSSGKKSNKDAGVSGPSESHSKNKKIGVLIISVGVLLVSFLVYLMLSYFDIGVNVFSGQEPEEVNVNNSEEVLTEENTDQSLEGEFDDPITEGDTEDVSFEDEELFFEDEDLVLDEEVQVEEEIVNEGSFIDTDGDGLSDSEENLLSTNSVVRDTDGDSFDDLTEFLGLYNPAGPGLLIDNPAISEYVNSIFSYSIYYSSSWDVNALLDGSSVIFSIDDMAYIQVLVEENILGLDIEEWYTNRFFELPEMALALNKDGVVGVFGSDLYSFYIQSPEDSRIYSIIYSFPENSPATYRNFFRMMVNSFKFL